jgi:hypothetical protein
MPQQPSMSALAYICPRCAGARADYTSTPPHLFSQQLHLALHHVNLILQVSLVVKQLLNASLKQQRQHKQCSRLQKMMQAMHTQ